jgi:hypothetical protein
MAAHFGFEPIGAHKAATPPGERVHRFGENVLALLVMLATNPSSARANVLWRDRALTCMSRKLLLERFGAPAPQRYAASRSRRPVPLHAE